ncbi:MAG TPA: DUF4147 domain-containing protein [Steroidobacteraceae bacterium]|nr:DUF4147 domain-containing protein [Steroidobacteraceae bacterium]
MYAAAIERVNGRACVARFLRGSSVSAAAPRVAVAAIGKAAGSMTLGALDTLGERVQQALVITKTGHAEVELAQHEVVELLESAHPVPDARSLAAGARLLDWTQALTPDVWPLFLISGGASSLVEHLRPGVDLQTVAALNRTGLASGWSIERLNAERAQLSAIKGGGLTARLQQPALALFISDVPGDDPAVIGSGLLGPLSADSIGKDQVNRRVVARLEDALAAAAEVAMAHGRTVEFGARRFCEDVHELAHDFAGTLRGSAAEVLAWGGESVVSLPAAPGRGGRNQHLALLLARAMQGQTGLAVLAAGTDGTDGVTDDAGALVDDTTWQSIELAGFDAETALARADTALALEAVGALLHTGPTGTNVGDLLLGIRYDC